MFPSRESLRYPGAAARAFCSGESLQRVSLPQPSAPFLRPKPGMAQVPDPGGGLVRSAARWDGCLFSASSVWRQLQIEELGAPPRGTKYSALAEYVRSIVPSTTATISNDGWVAGHLLALQVARVAARCLSRDSDPNQPPLFFSPKGRPLSKRLRASRHNKANLVCDIIAAIHNWGQRIARHDASASPTLLPSESGHLLPAPTCFAEPSAIRAFCRRRPRRSPLVPALVLAASVPSPNRPTVLSRGSGERLEAGAVGGAGGLLRTDGRRAASRRRPIRGRRR